MSNNKGIKQAVQKGKIFLIERIFDVYGWNGADNFYFFPGNFCYTAKNKKEREVLIKKFKSLRQAGKARIIVATKDFRDFVVFDADFHKNEQFTEDEIKQMLEVSKQKLVWFLRHDLDDEQSENAWWLVPDIYRRVLLARCRIALSSALKFKSELMCEILDEVVKDENLVYSDLTFDEIVKNDIVHLRHYTGVGYETGVCYDRDYIYVYEIQNIPTAFPLIDKKTIANGCLYRKKLEGELKDKVMDVAELDLNIDKVLTISAAIRKRIEEVAEDPQLQKIEFSGGIK